MRIMKLNGAHRVTTGCAPFFRAIRTLIIYIEKESEQLPAHAYTKNLKIVGKEYKKRNPIVRTGFLTVSG